MDMAFRDIWTLNDGLPNSKILNEAEERCSGCRHGKQAEVGRRQISRREYRQHQASKQFPGLRPACYENVCCCPGLAISVQLTHLAIPNGFCAVRNFPQIPATHLSANSSAT